MAAAVTIPELLTELSTFEIRTPANGPAHAAGFEHAVSILRSKFVSLCQKATTLDQIAAQLPKFNTIAVSVSPTASPAFRDGVNAARGHLYQRVSAILMREQRNQPAAAPEGSPTP
jgi:hypothetical protein